MIPMTPFISAHGVFLLALPAWAAFWVVWYRQYRRTVMRPGLQESFIRETRLRFKMGMVLFVGLGIFLSIPWRAALQVARFDWRQYDAASIQVEEYVYERFERRKLRTVILDDPADVEFTLAAIEAMEAAPGISHEGGGARAYVIRLCRRSGVMSPYSISVHLGPEGKPFSERREYLMYVDLDSSNLNRGVYQSDELVKFIRRRMEQDGARLERASG